MDTSFQLPPPPAPGQLHTRADEAMVVEYVYGLMQEAYEVRQELDEQADRNNNLHLGRCRMEAVDDGVTAVDINRIRNVDIAHVQVQTEETPRIKLTARETAEQPLAYLDLRVDVGDLEANGPLKDLFLSIDQRSWSPQAGGVGPDGAALDPEPLSDADRGKVEAAIAAGLLPAAALILVSDRTFADAEQTVFDVMWEECAADFYVREAALRKTIIGWHLPVYGFDDAKKRHTLYNPSHLQVFLDPTCTDVRDAAHGELLQFLDLYKAKARYPAYAADLEGAVIPAGGGLDAGTQGNFPFRIPKVYSNTRFRRPMVPVIHCWIRDYPFPVSTDDALAAGSVLRDKLTINAGRPAEMFDDGSEASPAVPAEEKDIFRLKGGAPAAGGAEVMGSEVTERDVFAGWPSRPGIREICIVGNKTVSDRETEFSDFPLVHFVDLPIIDSPYGQGQPEALEPLQVALNALLTDFVTHFHFFGTPSVAMPLSVAARLPGFKEGVYSAPHSEVWEIPDDLIQKFGSIDKLIGFIQPPPIPSDFWRFFDLLLSLIDKEGQVTEALQGEGQPQWSGDLVARLQQASRGLIGWKSQRMETGLQYLAKLMLHSINTRMSVEDLTRICGKYPPYVWNAMRTRRKSIELDVSVEIVSGSGQLREKSKQESIALNRNGQGPLSDTTLLERFNEDPKTELQNKVTEAQERAKAASQIQGIAGGPAVGTPAEPSSPPGQPPVPVAA